MKTIKQVTSDEKLIRRAYNGGNDKSAVSRLVSMHGMNKDVVRNRLMEIDKAIDGRSLTVREMNGAEIGEVPPKEDVSGMEPWYRRWKGVEGSGAELRKMIGGMG